MSCARLVGLIHGLHPPCLNAREIEQRVDELEQAQPVAMDEVKLRVVRLRNHCTCRHPLHLFERAQHQRQGSAKFVADVGEKLRLGAVDLGQRLDAPPLDFQSSFILFGSDPFSNVHSGRDYNDHAAGSIPDRHTGEVDDVLRTISPEIPQLAAEWLTGNGLLDRVSNPRLYVWRAVPPAALPEGSVKNVRTI